MNLNSSLSNPKNFKPDLTIPKLTIEEGTEANKELNDSNYIQKYSKVDRGYTDPPLPLQSIGLFSFLPAIGAKPNTKGIFGFAKIRGVFGTQNKADSYAEKIIREHDSYHKIYQVYVGKPFPCTLSSNYSADIKEIELQKDTENAMITFQREQNEKYKKEIKKLKEREEQLKKEALVSSENSDYDNYKILRTKKIQLNFTIQTQKEKLRELVSIYKKVDNDIEKYDNERSDYKELCRDDMIKAKKEAGVDKHEIIDSLIEDLSR